jgi:ribose/xylose/arabinose/galactoside ABC-type transport system permease subunit
MLVGLINGFLTAKVKLYDFIATLGTKTAIDGVSLLITLVSRHTCSTRILSFKN